jgi:predicted MPP superfamily phosphohydrolase
VVGANSLSILHISDIHFRDDVSGAPHDIDDDIRREVLADLGRLRDLGSIDLALISGDIAFGGKVSEYGTATAWLAAVSEYCKEGVGSIKVVPGNHDVDVSAIGKVARYARQELRRCVDVSIDGVLQDTMSDVDVVSALFRPLSAYIEFATAYGCQIDPQQWWWRYDGAAFPDGTPSSVSA